MADINLKPITMEEFDAAIAIYADGDDIPPETIIRIRRSVAVHNAIWNELQDVTKNLFRGDPNQLAPVNTRPQSVNEPFTEEVAVRASERARTFARCKHGIAMDTSCMHCRREMPARDPDKLPPVKSPSIVLHSARACETCDGTGTLNGAIVNNHLTAVDCGTCGGTGVEDA